MSWCNYWGLLVKDASVINAALLTGALVISIAIAPAGQAAGVQDCAGDQKPDVAIQVCSALLKNKALAAYRVSAFAGPARAYVQKKQFDKAIADFDRAIELPHLRRKVEILDGLSDPSFRLGRGRENGEIGR
jgi:hypothetical protein